MYKYKQISYKEAIEFCLPLHYSGRKPQVSIAYGAFYKDILKAVCIFGKPASPSLCKGVCGDKWSSQVYELNRLCKLENYNDTLSKFVSWCLRDLKKKNWIIVSYSDTSMNHTGYIYQACNFIYTGKTKERTDKFTPGNKHSRHYENNQEQQKYRKVRSAKHRYIYFCTSNKRTRKEWFKDLKYKIELYPKDKNKNYILGEFQKPIVIKCKERI